MVTPLSTTYRSNWLVTLFSYSSGYLTPCSLRADPTISAIHINTNQLTTAVKITAPYRPGRGTKADVMAPARVLGSGSGGNKLRWLCRSIVCEQQALASRSQGVTNHCTCE